MKKLDTVILTDLGWNSMGGLPGILLSLADCGLTSGKVIGPRNMKHAVAAMRNFVGRFESSNSLLSKKDLTELPFSVSLCSLTVGFNFGLNRTWIAFWICIGIEPVALAGTS